jgi:hypothetical protein
MSNVISGNFGYRKPSARKRLKQTVKERETSLRAAILSDPCDGAALAQAAKTKLLKLLSKNVAYSVTKIGRAEREWMSILEMQRLKRNGRL